MQLLNQTTKISANLAATISDMARHLSSVAVLCDRLATDLLTLDDETLTLWLNAQSPQDIMALFAAHESVGQNLNAASATITEAMAASGTPVNIPQIDVRPFQEKLAPSDRVMEFENGVFSVYTFNSRSSRT
jgi:hypothetical protein